MKTVSEKTDQIYMDYQAVLQKAGRLEELAAELSNVAQKEYDICGSAQRAWQGEGGEVFREKAMRSGKKVEKRAEELKKAAGALRKTAKRQYETEMRLAALFGK